MSKVLVVLTHWKRTGNLLRQLRAFRSQTVPVKIVVVDNSEIPLSSPLREGDEPSWHAIRDLSDDVYSFRINRGPSCRFIAPVMDLEHPYTLLYDDDAEPEPGAVEHLFNVAGDLRGSFSELGVIGRNFAEDEIGNLKYRRRDVPQTDKTQWVHMIGRAHFFRTSMINGVFDLRRRLQRSGVSQSEIDKHDDLMCLGMATTQLRPTLLAEEPEGCRLIGCELEDSDALHRQEGFIRSRNAMLGHLQRHKVIR